jgi:hypothetical protein
MANTIDFILIGYAILILIGFYFNFKQSKYSERKINILSLFSISAYFGIIIIFISSLYSSNLTGTYQDSFNNSIELKIDGSVHYNQLNGNILSCHTTGTWSKLDNNQLTINLEINSNCSFVSRYSGIWKIEDCYKNGQEEAGCLVKGNAYYFYKH